MSAIAEAVKAVFLAEEVKAIRRAAGLTQVAFAERMGTTPMTISRWERGDFEPHRPDAVLAWARQVTGRGEGDA